MYFGGVKILSLRLGARLPRWVNVGPGLEIGEDEQKVADRIGTECPVLEGCTGPTEPSRRFGDPGRGFSMSGQGVQACHRATRFRAVCPKRPDGFTGGTTATNTNLAGMCAFLHCLFRAGKLAPNGVGRGRRHPCEDCREL